MRLDGGEISREKVVQRVNRVNDDCDGRGGRVRGPVDTRGGSAARGNLSSIYAATHGRQPTRPAGHLAGPQHSRVGYSGPSRATGSTRRPRRRGGERDSLSAVGAGEKTAISEFPKGRKYLISLSFRGKASVRPAQVGGFDVNIVIHGSTAVRGRGDLVAYRWALWKLTAPWTHRTRPPHLGKRCAFSTSSTGPFPLNHSRKTPKGPKIALGNPDRPEKTGEL